MFISDELNGYIEDLIPKRDPLLTEMETYAKENGVPIMELVGIEIVLQLLKLQQPASILEIGSAIGYSAIRMAKALPSTKIVTIERDMDRYEKALEYIDKAGLKDRITIIFGDALEVSALVQKKGPFDSLFIDAAKKQYRRFFDIYSNMLAPAGMVLSDNILFKGLVVEKKIENRNVRSMVNKLKDYNEWLMSHPEYETTIYPIGDGIAVSKMR